MEQSVTVAVDRGSTLGHGDSAARISKRSVMKKRTLISTTAGLAVAAMLMGAGFVGTANAAEIDNNNITITQPQPDAVKNQLLQPTVKGDAENPLGTARVENTKNINDFAKTGGAIMTMLALAGALALWMAVFCFFSMS